MISETGMQFKNLADSCSPIAQGDPHPRKPESFVQAAIITLLSDEQELSIMKHCRLKTDDSMYEDMY